MNYETGDVPFHQRDVWNTCEVCGSTWFGPSRALCDNHSDGEDEHEPDQA